MTMGYYQSSKGEVDTEGLGYAAQTIVYQFTMS